VTSARLGSAVILGGLLACGATAPGPGLEPPEGGIRILFVGNSLTYVNDLPNTLAALAREAGDTIMVATEAGPNLALIDHLNGATRAAESIRAGGWSYVVLQQGPTPAGICRDSLVLWARMFEPLIREVGAEPAVLMTWPAAGSSLRLETVHESFAQAAAAVHGLFLPAGDAWGAARTEDPGIDLYGPDGFHPSPMGTFLTSLVIYERITGRDPRTLPAVAFAAGHRLELPEATIRLLQRAAHEANARSPARPAADRPADGSAPQPASC
jgi:hypothetical protein